MEYTGELDEDRVIVLDVGAHCLKIGYAGDQAPTVISPNIVGLKKENGDEDEHFLGKDAMTNRSDLILSYPVDHGNLMQPDYFQERQVLIVEPTLFPRKFKLKVAEVLFETLQVQGIKFISSALTSLYACGTLSGIVVEVGDSTSSVIPVSNNVINYKSVRMNETAGRNSASFFVRKGNSQRNQRICLSLSILHLGSFEDIREDTKKILTPAYQTEYTLPDQSVIKLNDERFLAPEILFNPLLIGCEDEPLDSLFVHALAGVPADKRAELCRGIVLAGGTTLLSGFPERLLMSLRQRHAAECPLKIIANKDRGAISWIGGSVLGSQATTPSSFITREQYHADGGERLVLGFGK